MWHLNQLFFSLQPSCQTPSLHTDKKLPAALLDGGSAEGSPVVEAASALPDLLGDIPFTLAPHVIAMQAGFPVVSDVLLSFNVNYNLASYKYDFTLENSVLHNSPSVWMLKLLLVRSEGNLAGRLF